MKNFLLAIITAASVQTTFAQHGPQPASEKPETFRDCATCPQMVKIPAGTFTMGSPETEKGRIGEVKHGPTEGPQRKVTVNAFAAGKYDVTRGEWAAFVKETNRETVGYCPWAHLKGDTGQAWIPNPKASWKNLGFAQDDNHPVVCVTWNDAQDYAKWLSKKTGHHYRLLTEAEWEYAARAGTTTPFWWGDTADRAHANYGNDAQRGEGLAVGPDKWDYATSPVDAFPPNPFGLYDMVGNVMQWVQDCFSYTYLDHPVDGSAYAADSTMKGNGDNEPLNNKKACDFHMVRGGCYGDPGLVCRVAARNAGPNPGIMTPDISKSAGGGFRVARDL